MRIDAAQERSALAMPRYVAFLRAINVGGRNVRMEELRRLFGELGLSGVETFIASGNVIFGTRARSEASLAGKIERHLLDALGWEVATFLRTDAEVAAIAASRPFPDAEMESAGAISVGFLAEPLGGEQRGALAALESDVDALRVEGREIWWLCRVRQSESDFSNVRFERSVGVRSTFRGLNTLRRLAARYPPAG